MSSFKLKIKRISMTSKLSSISNCNGRRYIYYKFLYEMLYIFDLVKFVNTYNFVSMILPNFNNAFILRNIITRSIFRKKFLKNFFKTRELLLIIPKVLY